MRQYKLFILFIQVAFTSSLVAGFERTAQPTALFARAFSGAAFASESNVWLNPAALFGIASFRSSLFYSPSPFQLPQLTNYGLLIADDIEGVKVALSLRSFGFSLYRETSGSLTAALTEIENFGVGLTLSLNHLAIQNYGNATKVGIDIGSIYTVTSELAIGLSLTNINGATFGGDDDIPRVLLAGLSYRVLENALFTIDLVKDVRYDATFRAGIEFSPHEIFIVRSGVQGEPSRLFGGIGLRITPFVIDYGTATHDDLGLTHSIGISFAP
ncbi:MAG: hypothetical protein AB1728_14415 [Bacteroidota bacterium]